MQEEPPLRLWGLPEWRGSPARVFGPERRFQLLTVLALQAGRWVERDRLAALLWPEREAAEARRNLRKVVHDTHALPGLPALQVQGHALCWPVASDVAAFEAQRGTDAAAALAWRRGPPLQGLDDARNAAWTEWLQAERSRLEQAWLATALDHARRQARPADQVLAARAVLAVDPYDETAVQLLLQAEIACGHAAQAQAEYRRYCTLLAQNLGVEPSRTLRELLATAQAAPATAVAPVLPAPEPADGFVGRRTELAEAEAALARHGCRALLLLGPGGIGKSRLAQSLLPRCAALFPGGVFWVELQDAGSPDAALEAVAQALGITLKEPGDAVGQLLRQLQQHLPAGRCLLALDNAEHLPTLGPVLQRLLDGAPGLVLLVTSRQRLPLAGLVVLPLQGLAVPDEDSRDFEAASGFDAVRLFELRARLVRPEFNLRRHLPSVLFIVEAVGGMPLAIELAAAWLRLLPPAQVAQDLQGSFDLLEHDPGALQAPARAQHHSLRTVLDGSWQLLSPLERSALAALSVFHGGFTRAAARAVAGCSLPMLSSLADKSLLAVDEQGRFALHPVVAAHAAERLALQPGQAVPLRQRHAEFYARHLDGLAQQLGTEQGRLVQAVAAEAANLRAAWQAAVALQRAELVALMVPPLRVSFELRGRLQEGAAELRLALQLAESGPAALRALALVRQAAAMLHFRAGDLAEAQTLAQGALATARACRAPAVAAGALITLGNCQGARGERRAARQYLQRALVLARHHGDRQLLGSALGNLGIAEKQLGHWDAALDLYGEALAIARELGDRNAAAVHMNNLGALLRDQGRAPESRALLQEGLALCRSHGLPNMRLFMWLNLGLLHLAQGEWDAAEQPLQQALEAATAAGVRQVQLSADLSLAAVAIARAAAVAAPAAVMAPSAALVRLQRVARAAREHRMHGLLADAVYHYATWQALLPATQARAAEVLQLCAQDRGSDISHLARARRALAGLGCPAPASVHDASAGLAAVVDELLAASVGDAG